MNDRSEGETGERFRCDFCGAEVPRVRRVALDRDYDRLQKPHRVQYACPECSARKEEERARSSAGSGGRGPA